MADRSKKSTSGAEPGRGRRNPLNALLIVALLAAALAVGAAFGIFALWLVWFEGNPRMTLARVQVASSTNMADRGYWSGARQNAELKRRLGLRDMMPLWELDPGELRRKLEDPRIFSSILSARVYTVQPDTLCIMITERTPVAIVRGSTLMADEGCMLIKRGESVFARGRLPEITGIEPAVTPGIRDSRLSPAVALITEVLKTNHPGSKLDVQEIELAYPDKMFCRFRYGNSEVRYKATFPLLHYEEKLALQLQALKQALFEDGRERHDFELSFDGQVVEKPAAAELNNKTREYRSR